MTTYSLTYVDADGRIVDVWELEDDGSFSLEDELRQAAYDAVTVGRVELRRDGTLVAGAHYVRGQGIRVTGTLATE